MSEPEPAFDTDALEATVSAELGTQVLDTAVVHDGLNLSIAVSTPSADPAYVLRRPNALRETALFNELEREYRVLDRLEPTPIPAPEPVLFCEDESIVGEPFLLETWRDGESVPLGAALPERFRNTPSRRRVGELLVDTLADIHTVDVRQFEDACEVVTPRDQVARAMDRLDDAERITGRALPTLRSVGEWLSANAPSDPETALVHGDYRPSNVLFAGTAEPEITGVLDWETAMLGDPLTELGYLLLRWRDAGDPTPSLDDLESAHPDEEGIRELRAVTERGLAPFTGEPGSPSRPELVNRYEQRTGISVENLRYYRAHSAFMLAAVWEDLHRHSIEAGAASGKAPFVGYMAELAGGIVRGEY